MSYCVIHYNGYTEDDEKLLYLNQENYDRLLLAKQSRSELGGDNTHAEQGNSIPQSYDDNLFYHRKCYQKYTKAISVLKTKKGVTDTPCQPSSSRVKRTGDLGKTLFPDYCMICKKSGPIHVKKKKQFPRLLELEKAEKSIEDAADIRQDDIMLAAIRSVYSLRAA